MELTSEHLEILKHTDKNRYFCGDSKEMQELCDLKMMVYVGHKPFVPAPYFELMNDGKSTLDDLRELGVTW